MPPTRPSPITIALAVVTVGLGVLGVWLVTREPPRAAEPPAVELAEAPPPRPAQPVPAPARTPAPVEPPAPEPPPAAPPALADEPAPAASPDAGAEPDAAGRIRPEIRLANHLQRLAEADERAFESLHLGEDQRAAIRRINEDFKRRASGADWRQVASPVDRRDAITQALGSADAGRQFDLAERHAIREVRGHARFEWGRQLRE